MPNYLVFKTSILIFWENNVHKSYITNFKTDFTQIFLTKYGCFCSTVNIQINYNLWVKIKYQPQKILIMIIICFLKNQNDFINQMNNSYRITCITVFVTPGTIHAVWKSKRTIWPEWRWYFISIWDTPKSKINFKI